MGVALALVLLLLKSSAQCHQKVQLQLFFTDVQLPRASQSQTALKSPASVKKAPSHRLGIASYQTPDYQVLFSALGTSFKITMHDVLECRKDGNSLKGLVVVYMCTCIENSTENSDSMQEREKGRIGMQ